MTRATSPGSSAPFAHIPGLDGLRALSVLAVIGYHAHLPGLSGGFLGVEVFFVISGYLITSLILHEFAQTGSLDLKAFWLRRARRLLPALWLVLAAVALGGAFLLGPGAAQFRGDLLASLFYVENWHQIRSGGSYFADQGLPLLRHIWSLAVEEQFYLLWPLVALGLLKAGRRWALGAGTALLALASLGAMVWLAEPHHPSRVAALESLNRVYLGTDTRAFGILLGALLALVPLTPGRRVGVLLDGLALAALAGLLALCAGVSIQDPRLYPGGFLLVDGLTLLVLASLGRRTPGWTSRLLDLAPFVWLGRRSYGIYLLHWPLLRLLGRPDHGWQGLALAFALTLLLAEASFRWVEEPIRSGALGRFLGSLQVARWRQRALAMALGGLLGSSLVAAARLALLPGYRDEVAESLKAAEVALDGASGAVPPPPLPDPVPIPVVIPVIPEGRLEGLQVTAIGDSVMKGAALALAQAGREHLGETNLRIQAEESRPFGWAKDVVRRCREEARLGDVVVVHLGTNNSHIPPGDFDKLMAQVSDRRLVLFLTAKSDKAEICDQVNLSLARMAAAYPNAQVFDWKAASQGHPDLFYPDGTHLRPTGARFYAAAILQRIATLVPPSRMSRAGAPPAAPVAAAQPTGSPASGAAHPGSE